ncbi:MAG: hypothetical protein AAGB00_11970 [Planctomycetota bacterium]
MSEQRPRVAPEALASLVARAPDRVRRRLDRSPRAAAEWAWSRGADGWSIDTGGETVTLPLEAVDSSDAVRCTCLLSPACYHTLACLTTLAVEDAQVDASQGEPEAGAKEQASGSPSRATAASGTTITVTDGQLVASEGMLVAAAQLLRVGVANAGLVTQSGLLRAVHQCRAEGMHRLAGIAIRVIEGARRHRDRAADADTDQLTDDVSALLETALRVRRGPPLPAFWVGTARREFFPVQPRTLHGLFAEPIITASGYAGAAAYFLGEDGAVYSVSEARPGDAQLARDAYGGGIEFGPIVQPAMRLARGRYRGAELTASHDGRLGRGKAARVVERGDSDWGSEPVRARFEQPLADQSHRFYTLAAQPADARPAGWDLVFFRGVVLGAAGPNLLVQPSGGQRPLRLAVANESDEASFRENLRLLSHAPGLRLDVIGRGVVGEPGALQPLAIGHASDAADGQPEAAGEPPRLELPRAWRGRVNLGFDKLDSRHFSRSRSAEVVLTPEPDERPAGVEPLAAYRRRLNAFLIAGSATQLAAGLSTVGAEVGRLHQHGYETGAALLDGLLRRAPGGPSDVESFLAASLYLRHCRIEVARALAEGEANR